LLLRVLKFSTAYEGNIEEVHGFMPVGDVIPDDYEAFKPCGTTPLIDAVFSSIGATADYGKKLMDNDFLVNGIVIVLTDGQENASTMTEAMIKQQVESLAREEKLESLVSILVGINAQSFRNGLERFKDACGIDQYIDAGDATPQKLAKLAEFVSQSVSSQSQSLGTGGPSQNISATI
jgi:uncharacterized protein YegL